MRQALSPPARVPGTPTHAGTVHQPVSTAVHSAFGEVTGFSDQSFAISLTNVYSRHLAFQTSPHAGDLGPTVHSGLVIAADTSWFTGPFRRSLCGTSVSFIRRLSCSPSLPQSGRHSASPSAQLWLLRIRARLPVLPSAASICAGLLAFSTGG